MSEAVPTEGIIVAPRVRAFGELASRLSGWLGVRLGSNTLRLDNFEYPRGAGQSHETILFDAHWIEAGESRSKGMVVRIKPTSFTVFQDDMFDAEYELMRVLHSDGRIPVAEVLWLEQDPSVLGAPFFVMEKLSGKVAVSHPPYMESGWVVEATAQQRSNLWHAAVRALGTLPTMPLELFDFLQAGADGGGFDQEWRRWERYLNHIERPERPLADYREVWTLLGQTSPRHPAPGLVWGDARIGNVLVDDFDVVALMDWEQPSLGGALHDLGWWLFTQRVFMLRNGGLLPGIPDREDTIAIWSEAAGLTTHDLEWYEAFAGFKLAALRVNMMDLRGETPPGGNYSDIPLMSVLRDFIRDAGIA